MVEILTERSICPRHNCTPPLLEKNACNAPVESRTSLLCSAYF